MKRCRREGERTYLLLVSSFFVRLLRSGNLSRSPATCGWSRLVFLITLPSPAGDWQKVRTGEEVARVATSQVTKPQAGLTPLATQVPGS